MISVIGKFIQKYELVKDLQKYSLLLVGWETAERLAIL